MMFTSSELLAAMSRSELLIPASLSSLGLAPFPAITSASSSSVACSTSFSSFSTSTTSCPSCESIRTVLSPTSPAPMITVCKALDLLPTVGLYEWGAVQGLFGSSDHEHVPVVQYGVAVGQRPWSALRLEGQDCEAYLLRETCPATPLGPGLRSEPRLLRDRRNRAGRERPSSSRAALLSSARAVSPYRCLPYRRPSRGDRRWPALRFWVPRPPSRQPSRECRPRRGSRPSSRRRRRSPRRSGPAWRPRPWRPRPRGGRSAGRPRGPVLRPPSCLWRALRVPTSRACRPWRCRDAPGRRQRTADSSAADVDRRSPLWVRLRLTQYLVGDGGGVAFSEEEVADQVDDRVALRPAEVAVRRLASSVTQVKQEGRYGVRDDRAYGTQHLVTSDLDAPHLQHVHKLRGVLDLHLEEQNRHPRRDVVVLALLPLLPGVLFLGAVAAAVGDEVDITPLGRLLDEAPGLLVQVYPLLPELGGALHTRDQGDSYDRADKEQGYGDAIWTLVDVGG